VSEGTFGNSEHSTALESNHRSTPPQQPPQHSTAALTAALPAFPPQHSALQHFHRSTQHSTDTAALPALPLQHSALHRSRQQQLRSGSDHRLRSGSDHRLTAPVRLTANSSGPANSSRPVGSSVGGGWSNSGWVDRDSNSGWLTGWIIGGCGWTAQRPSKSSGGVWRWNGKIGGRMGGWVEEWVDGWKNRCEGEECCSLCYSVCWAGCVTACCGVITLTVKAVRNVTVFKRACHQRIVLMARVLGFLIILSVFWFFLFSCPLRLEALGLEDLLHDWRRSSFSWMATVMFTVKRTIVQLHNCTIVQVQPLQLYNCTIVQVQLYKYNHASTFT
jgi:hypothetical protein